MCVDKLLKLFAVLAMVGRHMNSIVVADEVDRNDLAREQSLGARQDFLEHRRRVRDRAADRSEHFAGRFLLLKRLFRLVEQPDVFERDRRLRAECLQQCDFALAEWPHVQSPQQDRAERLPFAIEGCHKHSAMAEARCNVVTQRILGGLSKEVGYLYGLLLEHRASRKGVAGYGQRIDVAHLIRGRSLRRKVPKHVSLDQVHRRGGRIAQPRGPIGDRVEHRLHVGWRTRYDAQDFGDRRLLVQRLLRFVEKPHIVDGDRGLAGKRLHQGDLIRREWSRFATEKEDGAIRPAFAHQRNGQHGPGAELNHVLPHILKLGVEQREDVGVVDGFAIECGAPG